MPPPKNYDDRALTAARAANRAWKQAFVKGQIEAGEPVHPACIKALQDEGASVEKVS